MVDISDFILTGKRNGISQSELQAVTGLKSRDVRREVLRARINGKLICSDVNGYYFPETEEDIREFVIQRKAAIKTAGKAIQPFVKALKEGR